MCAISCWHNLHTINRFAISCLFICFVCFLIHIFCYLKSINKQHILFLCKLFNCLNIGVIFCYQCSCCCICWIMMWFDSSIICIIKSWYWCYKNRYSSYFSRCLDILCKIPLISTTTIIRIKAVTILWSKRWWCCHFSSCCYRIYSVSIWFSKWYISIFKISFSISAIIVTKLYKQIIAFFNIGFYLI